MIWDPFERFLSAALIMLFLATFVIYYSKGRKQENPKEKALFYGLGVITLVTCAMEKFFRYISDFLVEGEYKDYVFLGTYEYEYLNIEFLIFRKLLFICLFGGFAGFCLLTAKIKYKRLNYIIAAVLLIFMALIPFIPFDTLQSVQMIVYFPGIYYCVLYLTFLTKWAREEYKGISFHLIMGFFIYQFSFFLNTFQVKNTNVFPLSLGPLLMILSVFIMILPFIVNPEFYNKSQLYYRIIALSVNAVSLLFMLFVYLMLPLYFVFFITMVFISNLIFTFLNLKYIKAGCSSEKEQERDLIAVFSRPKQVTEEEVSISKEKKVCLVCKNEILKFNFVCPECKSFYCEKCYTALSGLENACWACDHALDESKPVKLKKKEKIGVEIEPELYKKNSEKS